MFTSDERLDNTTALTRPRQFARPTTATSGDGTRPGLTPRTMFFLSRALVVYARLGACTPAELTGFGLYQNHDMVVGGG